MSDSNHIAPDPERMSQPDVLLLPAEYFFVERVEVPAAVTHGELADYAELSIESIAPFPLEQLRWGFFAAPDGHSILIYAALHERLKRAGYKDLESYKWVVPDFATLQGARFSRQTQIVLEGETFETSWLQPEGEGLPLEVQTYRNDGVLAASTGNSAEANSKTSTPLARDRYRSATSAATLHLRLLPLKLTEKGLPIFHFETIGETPVEGHWSPLTPSEASLWHADIRPAGFKGIERKARRTTALITQITGYAGLFVLFLLLLEGLLSIGQFWLGTRQAKVDAQSTAVRRIEDKQSLMHKLEQVAQNELRPIAILEAANQIRIGLGTTGIEYDEVAIEGGNRLTIEGKANTINELNAYTEALRQSGNFERIETKQLTRSGKTTFTATLDYRRKQPSDLVGSPPMEPAVAEASNPETEGGVE